LLPGFELVADELDLHDAIADADVVVTGEGYLDEQSFEGKVVGGVQAMAGEADKPVGAIVGDAAPEAATHIDHVNLTDEYGAEKAMNEPLWCIERAAATLLQRLTAQPN
jgi:glycerate kinase